MLYDLSRLVSNYFPTIDFFNNNTERDSIFEIPSFKFIIELYKPRLPFTMERKTNDCIRELKEILFKINHEIVYLESCENKLRDNDIEYMARKLVEDCILKTEQQLKNAQIPLNAWGSLSKLSNLMASYIKAPINFISLKHVLAASNQAIEVFFYNIYKVREDSLVATRKAVEEYKRVKLERLYDLLD
jgi:hypothetical protein